jgi:hypothetical protein
MRRNFSGGPALIAWFALTCGVACQSTDRPSLDRETLNGSANEAAAAAPTESTETPPSSTPPTGGGEGTEAQLAVASTEPDNAVGGQPNGEACGEDAGACGDAGAAPSICLPTGPRDCTSDLDNDCDGQPDNVLDEVCVCAPASVEPCDDHPGLDGRGQCVAGSRTCLLDAATLTTTWGDCEGAVGPGEQDSCTLRGDDSDCDGTPNTDCRCVDGDTQPCGPATEDGICQRGTSTCVNGAFGECVGEVTPSARNCGSQQDNDCDGRPDNTIDNTCRCAIGSEQACGPHPGDGNGQCQAGSQTCEGRANNSTSGFGACIGSVGPAARDTCAGGNDANCNGIPNEGCRCINGDTQQCGSTSTGPCSFGSQTCVNGNFGQCQGAVNPAPRNCGSTNDNDCDGRPDNTIDNVCESPAGSPCADDRDCSTGTCDLWYRDSDGDGYGSPTATLRSCGDSRGPVQPQENYVTRAGDCCDLAGADREAASQISPGQTDFFPSRQTVCPEVAGFDYNCSGTEDGVYAAFENFRNCLEFPVSECNGVELWSGSVPRCGASGIVFFCGRATSGECSASAPLPVPGGVQGTVNTCN